MSGAEKTTTWRSTREHQDTPESRQDLKVRHDIGDGNGTENDHRTQGIGEENTSGTKRGGRDENGGPRVQTGEGCKTPAFTDRKNFMKERLRQENREKLKKSEKRVARRETSGESHRAAKYEAKQKTNEDKKSRMQQQRQGSKAKGERGSKVVDDKMKASQNQITTLHTTLKAREDAWKTREDGAKKAGEEKVRVTEEKLVSEKNKVASLQPALKTKDEENGKNMVNEEKIRRRE